LTQKATLTQSESTEKLPASGGMLANAIERHCASELASFHTPGHKGGANFRCGQNLWAQDVTELPGLDELAYASGVLASVQLQASKLWKAKASFISTNGASACLMAAIIACSPRGAKILLPRNVHRSAVNALVMTGLEPIWYEPDFDENWNAWGQVDVRRFAEALQQHGKSLAAAVIVSPTYAGAISDCSQIAALCRNLSVPLIVDEAHGAHLAVNEDMPADALAGGADIVVHSLHKTLSAMTQTGVVHVGSESCVDADLVRLALNMVQSSSPNYILMTSIEAALREVQSGAYIRRAGQLSGVARDRIESEPDFHLYSAPEQDPFHLLIRKDGITPAELMNHLARHGVFAETLLGNGVLLLVGCGTTPADVELLASVCRKSSDAPATAIKHGTNDYPAVSLDAQTNSQPTVEPKDNDGINSHRSETSKITFGEQVLSPREAFFSQTESVALADAVGRIAAECVAPCPPGSPVVVPGQRVTEAALNFCKLPALRVVVVSLQGDQ